MHSNALLMYSCSFLVYNEVFCRTEMQQCMLGGVQCRLDSNIERIRRMGMVVGECLSQILDTPGSQLKFQVSHLDFKHRFLTMKTSCYLIRIKPESILHLQLAKVSDVHITFCELEMLISFLDSFDANEAVVVCQYEPDEEIRELKSLMESPSVEDDEQHQPDTSTRWKCTFHSIFLCFNQLKHAATYIPKQLI